MEALLICVILHTSVLAEGVSLNSGLLSESQPYGIIQCIRKCLLQPACVGVVHKEFMCSLGKQHAGFQSSLDTVNSVYINKSSINDGLQQILKTECNAASCSDRHDCQPLKSGYHCIAKECAAFPFTFTNTFVNLTIGATNNLSCADNTLSGSPVQTCDLDGNWAPGDLVCTPPFVCDTSIGYVSYPEGCFHTVRSRFGKSQALAHCQQEGAKLARIDSQAKYDAMVTEVGSGGYTTSKDLMPT